MKCVLLATTAALALMVTTAEAQTVAEQVVAGLQAQGFERVEVTRGPTQVRIEGIRQDMKVELVYDAGTGELLSREVEEVDGDDYAPGVDLDRDEEDFVGPGDAPEDESEDHDRGHGNDPDGFDDDNPGRRHENRDRGGDDSPGRGRGHGGNDDARGGDDDGGERGKGRD